MLFSYNRMFNDLKNNSELQIKNAVYGRYGGHTFIIMMIVIIASYYTINFLKLPNWLFFFIYWLTIIGGISEIISRKSSLGMTSDSFIIIKYFRLGHNIHTIEDANVILFNTCCIEEIKMSNIKSIDYRKIFKSNIVTIIYENNRGKIKNIKLYYNDKRYGLGFDVHKKHASEISKKLIELQKVLDKGDY